MANSTLGVSRRRLTVLLLLSTAVVAAYVVRWGVMDSGQIARSDYIDTDTAGTLWRTGLGAQLYSDQAQAKVYASLIAGDHQGLIIYNHAPLTAVLAAPVSFLDVGAGYRIWSAAQLVLLLVALIVVLRFAPWDERGPPLAKPAFLMLALAGIPTMAMLLEGQGLGLAGLGLAVFYVLWRRERFGAAGFVLALAACIDKPHLFIGIAVWLLARAQRRSILGAAGGVAVAAVLSLLLVGPAGCAGFIGSLIHFTGVWSSQGSYGFVGIFVGWFGQTAAARVVASILGGLAVVAAFVFGRRSARGAVNGLGHWFGLAVVASLVASPHLNAHDLALLAPVLLWAAADANLRQSRSWPDPVSKRLLVCWLLLNLAVALDYSGPKLPGLVGQATPWVMGAAVTMAVLRRGVPTGELAPHLQ